jgi:ubiquinone/menaquinone biosynthesis C-methylase UbiE
MSYYLTTVAASGQVNTPPGSYLTVKEWARNAFVTDRSRVLEIGCSTGFITIEMARYTGATCVGIDLHGESIETAVKNTDNYVKKLVSFQQANARDLPFENGSFGHVVVGGHLPFIPPGLRRLHIDEALRVLKPWGYLLVALYYYHAAPPRRLVTEFNRAIGTRLSPKGSKKYWAGLFDDRLITLEYQADYEVFPGEESRKKEYIAQLAPETRAAWKKNIRLFNENAKFLAYFVRIYRKIPNETGLMVQVPRGGIYRVKRTSSQEF